MLFLKKNLFKCRNSIKKIILDKVCKKILDCLYGDDEFLYENQQQNIYEFCKNTDMFSL